MDPGTPSADAIGFNVAAIHSVISVIWLHKYLRVLCGRSPHGLNVSSPTSRVNTRKLGGFNDISQPIHTAYYTGDYTDRWLPYKVLVQYE